MRAAVGLVALLAVGAALVSGGSRDDSVRYRYLPATNMLRTVSTYGTERVVTVRSLGDPGLVDARPAWLMAARPLGAGAPAWAWRMYGRSLLVLRALTNRRTGAVLAGARDGWAYVWPRDAGAVALAFASADYRAEARRIAHFLLGLDLGGGARFHADGSPVEGRDAQGDAQGWVTAAARAAGLSTRPASLPWRNRADYQEGDDGTYLANAIAANADLSPFATRRGLVREAGDPDSGLDSAAAWAVLPFPQPRLFPVARRTLLRIAAASTRFGIVPSESWGGGDDPWTAPTAWTAWSLAALGERRAALRLMAAMRRTATPSGMLPERVDVRTGAPTSTTPLAWSHAFAILALRELWP
jgi:glucoamylase